MEEEFFVGCVRSMNYGLSLKSENREDFYKRRILFIIKFMKNLEKLEKN